MAACSTADLLDMCNYSTCNRSAFTVSIFLYVQLANGVNILLKLGETSVWFERPFDVLAMQTQIKDDIEDPMPEFRGKVYIELRTTVRRTRWEPLRD